MQLTHLACKTTIVFARGFHVHVCMCLSVKQLKSLYQRLTWRKYWLWLPRRSYHLLVVLSPVMDYHALKIHLTVSGYKDLTTYKKIAVPKH